jgi:hypothetical protein
MVWREIAIFGTRDDDVGVYRTKSETRPQIVTFALNFSEFKKITKLIDIQLGDNVLLANKMKAVLRSSSHVRSLLVIYGSLVYLSIVLVLSVSDAMGSPQIVSLSGSGPVSVSVSPSTVSVLQGRTAQLSASISGASNSGVTWSVRPAGNGTISTSGLYTAPPVLSSNLFAY